MRTVTVNILKMAYGGYGLGRFEGKVLFVPYTAPGDEIRAVIVKEHRDHAFGLIEQVISGSGSRVEPACPNFTRCGGCDYLHVAYDAELAIKREILIDSLKRTAGLAEHRIPVLESVSGERFHYRSHASMKMDRRGAGFYERESRKVAPFPAEGCRLLSAELIVHVRDLGPVRGKELKAAVDCHGGVITSLDKRPGPVREMENGVRYDRDVSCFFQANRSLRAAMLGTVAQFASLGAGDSFLDLGCGVGFFTLYLARDGARGTGVDRDGRAIGWARHNARLNGVRGVSFLEGDLSSPVRMRHVPRVIVCDPPRAGLSKEARRTMAAARPERVVYVSCNPATFARDTRDFIAGGYGLSRVTLFDMFPATAHLELVSLFELKTAQSETLKTAAGR
jgi:23S rRNA (uracil1939-C5)-methyltransferase